MTDPLDHFADIMELSPVRQSGPVDHQHRQAQCACRFDLGDRAAPPCILRHDQINAMRFHQRPVPRQYEGTAIHHQPMTGQCGRRVGRVDEAQQIMMLRSRGECVDMHAPDSQHDAPRRSVERRDSARNIGNAKPAIARFLIPFGPGQRDQRHTDIFCGGHRIRAHPGSKGMGCIDQMGDVRLLQIARQSRHAAESADPRRHGLVRRSGGAPGITERRSDSALRTGPGERACLGRSAKDQEMSHG